ncbi:MAG: hypothetical protein IJT47_04820 [Selenomonadaceae bacterium]|nr:hypothetical protein [Selenomonadaceae bacterium]
MRGDIGGKYGAHAGNRLKLGVKIRHKASNPVSKAAIDDSSDFNCARYWRIMREKLDEASMIPKEFFAVC